MVEQKRFTGPTPNGRGTCQVCNNNISEQVKKYSMDRFNKPLCIECQKFEKGEGFREPQQPMRNELPSHQELVMMAHKYGKGLVSIETEELPAESFKGVTNSGNTQEYLMYKFKATVKCINKEGNNQLFTAHGDAHEFNVTKNIFPHLYRMAETRAINRALRLMLGEGVTAEELGNLPDAEEEDKDGNKTP